MKVLGIRTLPIRSDPNRQRVFIELVCRRPWDLGVQTEELIKLDFPEAFSACTAPEECTRPHCFEHTLLGILDESVGSNDWEGETSPLGNHHFVVWVETWATVPKSVIHAVVKFTLRYTLKVMRRGERLDVKSAIRSFRCLLDKLCTPKEEYSQPNEAGIPTHSA